MFVVNTSLRLNELMKDALTLITGKLDIQMKWNDTLMQKQLYTHGAQDKDFYLDMVMHIKMPWIIPLSIRIIIHNILMGH